MSNTYNEITVSRLERKPDKITTVEDLLVKLNLFKDEADHFSKEMRATATVNSRFYVKFKGMKQQRVLTFNYIITSNGTIHRLTLWASSPSKWLYFPRQPDPAPDWERLIPYLGSDKFITDLTTN